MVNAEYIRLLRDETRRIRNGIEDQLAGLTKEDKGGELGYLLRSSATDLGAIGVKLTTAGNLARMIEQEEE